MFPSIPATLINTLLVPAKTILINEGGIAGMIYFIKKGCIRAYIYNDGVPITLQFFFEGEPVTSLESFMTALPGRIAIETIEETEIAAISRSDFFRLIGEDAGFKNWFYDNAIKKLFTHTNRLLFLLTNKPFARYQQLITESPEILKRIPQHYIASYLGMTPVSLSRIRNRKK
jgi:CRP-like cAMP-binding protein